MRGADWLVTWRFDTAKAEYAMRLMSSGASKGGMIHDLE